MLDRRTTSPSQAAAATVDVGLRNYMLRVYNLMALGVAFTGVVAFLAATQLSFLHTSPLRWLLFIGIIGLGWFAPRLMLGGNTTLAHTVFWSYAAMWGLLIAPLAFAYSGADISRAFFITAAAFGGTSLYGYTTKRDLSPMGRFLAMATIGLLIAVLVNVFFLQSTGFHLLLSVIIVLVFAGMTAYETQAIRNSYHVADSTGTRESKAIFGAFLLYGSFVTMFIWILNIVGSLRN